MWSFRHAVMISAVVLGAAVVADRGHAQTLDWRERQLAAANKAEDILQNASKRKGVLAQYMVMRDTYLADKDPAFRVIFGQYLSWYQTFVGDYPASAKSFSISESLQKGDNTSPLADHDFTVQDALDAIPRLAEKRQIVLFNEAHNIPLTRTLIVQVLGRLRQQGFTYFAAETLYQSDAKLQERGYPVVDSGFYTAEPICAEMVRTALKLGFKVVAYEALSNATGDARETEQARNLNSEIFKKDPTARVVVDAGYSHVQKSGTYLGGSSMAAHLKKLTGIDPLVIEQTMLIPHGDNGTDHPYYTEVMRSLQPKQPIVFVTADGKPWALRAGYDVNVFFPPEQFHQGRPTWLTLGGLRRAYTVTGEICEHQFPCLIEARYVGESEDAIPADRIVLDAVVQNITPDPRVTVNHNVSVEELYLRPGNYVLTSRGIDNHLLNRLAIKVADGGLNETAPLPPPAKS
jgi:hypothetical protein